MSAKDFPLMEPCELAEDDEVLDREDMPTVANFFYMLCYAVGRPDLIVTTPAETVRACTSYLDPLALLFSIEARTLVKRDLRCDYVRKSDELCSVRGKIDMVGSLKGGTLSCQKLRCSYEELLFDTPLNGIVRWGIDRVLKHSRKSPVCETARHNIASVRAYFSGIAPVAPTPANMNRIVFSANNRRYRAVVTLAMLMYHNEMPGKEDGGSSWSLAQPEAAMMRRLFEEFLRGFYADHLSEMEDGYSVKSGGERLYYLDRSGSAVEEPLLPVMTTDISINRIAETSDGGLPEKVIIDAKFNKSALVGARSGKGRKVRSAHLYQIQSYLINARANDGGRDIRGCLLYAKGRNAFDDALLETPSFALKTGRVYLAMVDLSLDSWWDIESQLIRIWQKISEPLDDWSTK